jgi:predicted ATP-grasp superfamily ATP-dependent carboligase
MAETKAAVKPKTVKIKLPLTRYEKDDVYVAVNCKSYLIPRGVTVEVPEAVVEVLENNEKERAKLFALMDESSAKTSAKELA